MSQIEVVRLYAHPLERVFNRYTDHESWTEWAGFGLVRLVRMGSPERNGKGAERAFASAPGLREEVTAFEPNVRMSYRISSGGFPMTRHSGEVLFTQQGAATRVTWRVSFESRIPGLGPVLELGITAVFRRVLTGLGKDLDKHYPG